MATTESSAGEQRFVMHDVSWQTYEALLADPGERHTRFTFDRGVLEFMAPSFEHERLKRRLGRLIEAVAEELGIPFVAGGSTTFKRHDLARGLEPDECYYVQHQDAVSERSEIDLEIDPPPDLAIEVDITSSSVDRMGIYAALGVPEIWRCDAGSLQIYRLTPGNEFELATQSGVFPELPMHDVHMFLFRQGAQDDLAMLRACRAWVRNVVIPGFPKPRPVADDRAPDAPASES